MKPCTVKGQTRCLASLSIRATCGRACEFSLHVHTESELQADAAKARRRARLADMLAEAAAPLRGTAGDLTAELFDARESDVPLFAWAGGGR